ncbi:hypothetical protein C8J57DRAFT_1636635 [Mycena rebaudengoi]|nr:hypothetical protein C8J57DRAFT_1636635 [Mycena rebaudengoi]
MITLALLLLLLAAFALPTLALDVSPYWRKPNITASPAERVNLAGAALALAVSQLNPVPQFFPNATNDAVAGCKGSFYGQLAEFDLITEQTVYKKTLNTYFQVAQMAHANFSTTKTYGRAAALAYLAYKDQSFLDYAMQAWWFGRAYTLSQDDVSAGRISTKDLSPLQQFCQDQTMAGGTFWLMDPVKPKVLALSTGYFLVLSALLAEATSDQLYFQAAVESWKFIQAHLLNDQNLVFEAIYAPQNYSCTIIRETQPYNTGIVIEGLSILIALTNDTETKNVLEQILTIAIPYNVWQGSDGVIAVVNQTNETQKMGDLNLVQGFAAAYARNATSVEMHAYLGHYLTVQFNAVVDLATVGGSNIYGNSWSGPPSSTYRGQDQTTALSALLGALVVSNDSIPSSSAPSTTSPSTTPEAVHPGKAKAVPIALGVVGGVFFLLAVLGIWIAKRRRAVQRRGSTQRLTSSHPFTAQTRSPSSAHFVTGCAPSLSNQQAEDNQRHRSDGLPVGISTVATHPQNHEIWAEDPPPDYEGMSEVHVQ